MVAVTTRLLFRTFVAKRIVMTKVGISMGDMNGVGLEIIFKTFRDPRIFHKITPILYGSPKVISFHRKALNLGDLPLHMIQSPEQAVPKKLNVISVSQEEFHVDFGKETPEAGTLARLSLQAAVADVRNGLVDVLVTAPINKHNIQGENFSFAGHTEYLAQAFNGQPLMLLCSDTMRVGTVTGHIALKDVADKLSQELILTKLRILHRTLIQDFGISLPKIAVLSIDPHAGDQGVIGQLDASLMEPTLRKALDEKMIALGPYPADGFFGSGQFKQFDAVLAMYHDQGLTPFKALNFHSGVNFTAGLSAVRTSPDHGVGYDIAGKGIANEQSFREAVFCAVDVFKNRKEQLSLEANQLIPRKKGRSDEE